MSVQKLIYSKIFCILFVLSNVPILFGQGKIQTGKNGMVVCAEPLAAKVGLNILKKGGNAVDAAVAVGFTLAVTYPTAGNLGGGGYMVIHTKDGKNRVIDFREKAPLASSRDMYLDKDKTVKTDMVQESETSSGVPGSVSGLLYALEKFGTIKRDVAIQPAINLAQNGFQLSSEAARSFQGILPHMQKYPSSIKAFSKNGVPYSAGELFIQKDLAKTLSLIKSKGVDGFYTGEIAELITRQMKQGNGFITLEDLSKYQPLEKEALTGTYRGYSVVTMPPSSSGGVALIEALNILENAKLDENNFNSSEYYHIYIEALKQVYADRAAHLGDPSFFTVPVSQLIDKSYAKKVFASIGKKAKPSTAIKAASLGAKKESEQTTHFSVIDKDGNAVSVTTTINSAYGSKVVVDGAGFLLNNEMDDFSAKPGVPNQFGLVGGEANSIAPEKRMLSSMTPTIILKNEKPYLILGSPGGSTIITTVLQVIVNCIDFKMPLAKAVAASRLHHQWLPDRIDYERFGLSQDIKLNLKKMGYHFGEIRTLGLVEAIQYDEVLNTFIGCSDPRGFGSAEGF